MATTKPNPKDPGYGTDEYVWDSLYNKTWHDTCGEFALSHAEAQADGRVQNDADMLAVTHDMITAGLRAVAGGGTTLYGLAREAERKEYKIALEWDYSSNFAHDWHTTIKDNAGRKPIVLFFTLAQNLVDAETGIGYSWRTPWVQDVVNHPLQGHFIEVTSVFDEGYLCVDGANPDVLKRYQVYRYDVLNSAQVRGLLMLEPKGTPVALPYTKNADGSLTYAKGNLHVGFANWVLKNNYTADILVPDTAITTDASYCVFADNQVLYWTHETGVLDMGKCGRLALSLSSVAKPIPPVVKSALAEVANILNPFAAASAHVNGALKGL